MHHPSQLLRIVEQQSSFASSLTGRMWDILDVCDGCSYEANERSLLMSTLCWSERLVG